MKKKGQVSKLIMASTLILSGLAFGADKAPRSPSYGTVMQGNAAVDFTTADYIVRPHLIGDDLQFISGYSAAGGAMIDGAFSFRASGINWFGSMANNTRPNNPVGFPATTGVISRVRAGVGFGSAFGAGIMYEFNKFSLEDDASDTKSSTTQVGDAYGVFGSFNLGDFSVYADLSRTTAPNATTVVEPPGSKTENTSSMTDIVVGAVKDTEGEGSHALAAQLSLNLSSQDDEAPLMEQSSMTIDLLINHGVPFKYNDQFAVFAGGILDLNYSSGENKTADSKTSTTNISLAPNIEFQKKLGKGFEASLGASVDILSWSSNSNEDAAKNTASISSTNTAFKGPGSQAGDVALGLRWEKDNLAVDGQMSKALLQTGPDFIGGAAPGVFASVGLTLGF